MITEFRDITFCREPNGSRTVLGAGASGFVYRALWCGEDVAIKSILWPTRYALRALAREAAVQSSLRHNAVLAVHGIAINEDGEGEEEVEEDGEKIGPREAVLIIELMEGGGSQLADWIGAGDAAPPLATRLKALSDIARALRFAHARGIAHGDVSPQNALSDESSVWGGARLIDWGAASRCSNNNGKANTTLFDESVTATADDRGSVDDSTPWRVGESAVDVAADAFSNFFVRGKGGGGETSRFSAAPAYADPSCPNLVSLEGDIFAFALTAWELLTCTDSGLDAAQLLAGHRPDTNALPRGASLLAPLLARAWSARVSDRPNASEFAAAISKAATVVVTAAECAANVRIFRRGGDAEDQDNLIDADVTTETITPNMTTPMGGGAWTPARSSSARTPVKITPVKAMPMVMSQSKERSKCATELPLATRAVAQSPILAAQDAYAAAMLRRLLP